TVLSPPTSPLVPYTTLFRSHQLSVGGKGNLLVLPDVFVLAPAEAVSRSVPVTLFVNSHVQHIAGKALGQGSHGGNHGTGENDTEDRKSTRLNSSHVSISYAV